MSDWTVDLEFEEGTSSKFWRARVEGKTLYVNYGKIGSTGQTQVKDFPDAGSAGREYAKLVAEKRKKGYVDAGGGGGGGDDDEDLDDETDDNGDEDAAPKKPIAKPMPPTPAPAARPPGGVKLVLDAGNRKVETYLYVDGKTVRMDAVETHASPDSAKKAHERLKKMLLGESYKEG